MFSCLRVRNKAKEETSAMRNGRMLLEELISSCNGKSNPIRIFSSQELTRATNNFHHQQLILHDPYYKLYSGFLEDRPITVKRYRRHIDEDSRLLQSAITDIVIGTQMSVNKNVLKLIGCCLETAFPILVYEFVSKRTVFYANRECRKPLSWKCRIKVAIDIAYAVAYLHTALSRPVVLRDIRPSTIILGEDDSAKLTDFSLSVTIPDGELHLLTDIVGKSGSGPPEYIVSGYVTEKLDVFLYGMLLLQLLTGQERPIFKHSDLGFEFLPHLKQLVENQTLIEIVDDTIKQDVEQHEVLAVAKLVIGCFCHEPEDRPTMTDVAKQLVCIHQSMH